LDQCHNIEGKLAAVIYSVLNCQEAYAKSLFVPRAALTDAQRRGDVLGAHRLLSDAYRTDVRPLLAQVRVEQGIAPDPIAAYLASGYEQKIARERGVADASGGFQ
jgi:L-rhamnose isomerase/sugar isomerase